MAIYDVIKQTMNDHKKKIELMQWAIISSVSSLVYSEYIRRIKQKRVPVVAIFVPPIKAVRELLDQNGQFMTLMSEQFVDMVKENHLYQEYKDAPEMVLFKDENVEIMKTIIDLYVIPNISRHIPDTISKKFGLENENQQVFREGMDIDLFNRQPISDSQMDYIVEEFMLQLLAMMPTVKRDIELPEDNSDITLAEDEFFSVSNENAICTIHFNDRIIGNKDVSGLLGFVTNTTFKLMNDGDISAKKNGRVVQFKITSGPFNQVAVVRHLGFVTPEEGGGE